MFDDNSVDDVLTTAHLVNNFDPAHTDELSHLLYDHQNCNIYLTSKVNQGKTDRKEKWYGTNFSKEPFTEELKEMIYSESTPDSGDFGLPSPNKYLPQNLELVAPNLEWSTEPVKIKDDKESVIWYKKDDKFGQPKCNITLRIYKKKNYLCDDPDPLKQVYNDIWTDVYDEVLR